MKNGLSGSMLLWSDRSMFDITGFLTSTQFVTQIASIIVAILVGFTGQVLTALFGTTGA